MITQKHLIHKLNANSITIVEQRDWILDNINKPAEHIVFVKYMSNICQVGPSWSTDPWADLDRLMDSLGLGVTYSYSEVPQESD